MNAPERIERFDVPTVEALRAIPKITDEQIARVRAVLAREVDPEEASPACVAWVAKCYHRPSWHERALEACNEILEGHGQEALEIDNDPRQHTDCGVRFCPAFSYVNFGDPYIATLARDHDAEMWCVASWGDLLAEYEAENIDPEEDEDEETDDEDEETDDEDT